MSVQVLADTTLVHRDEGAHDAEIHHLDKVVDVPVVQVVRFSQVQVVKMTVVIPYLHLVENIALLPDFRMVLVTQTSEIDMPVGVPTWGSSSSW